MTARSVRKAQARGRAAFSLSGVPLVAADLETQPEPEELTAQPAPTRPLKVLVVDDNVEVAQTVGWMLELEEADRRKDEFLATLAHELRNPLAPLRHGLDVLSRSPKSDDAVKIHQVMDRQLVHLVRLIDDLLDVSRVSQGKIEPRKERIQAADVLRAALESSQPLIDSARHSLTIEVPPEPIWLDADLTRLAQVVGNLLNNAAKYTPEGGRIGMSLGADGDNAVIAVSDNGLGIPADMQSKVFQLFAQVESHADRARGGLGIGLALAKQLVAMHKLEKYIRLAAQNVGFDRLEDEVDRAGLIATKAPLAIGVSRRHEYYRNPPTAFVSAHQFGQLEAVQAGHLHIDERQRDVVLKQKFEGFVSRARF
jgi:signal transduction histidine kinase